MDRESILALLITGAAMALGSLVVGRWSAPASPDEPAAFARLVAPVTVALVLLGVLAGFALVESDVVEAAEVVPIAALVPASLVLVVLGRALVRALAGARAMPATRTAATIGLVRPRVVIAGPFAQVLDEHERAAVAAHEEAHRRRRDPLRIWLGRLLADLQWPLPGVQTRLMSWLHALEVARDDEARAHGIDGADLASAILKAARFERAPVWSAAGLADDGARLNLRIARLLGPPPILPADRRILVRTLVPALAAALAIGALFGDLLFVEALGWHS